MRKLLKPLALLLVVLGLFAFQDSYMIISYAEETNNIVSGKCGENVYWELDRNTGVLRIYGTGEMNDYRYKYDLLGKETVIETEAPWLEQGYTEEITKVVIEKGVTYIGSSSFSSKRYVKANVCVNLKTVEIADTVTEIGSNAFRACSALTSIVIPNQVKLVGSYAFTSCSLNHIGWGSSVEKIGYGAFEKNKFVEMKIPQQIKYIGREAFSCNDYLQEISVPNGCEVDWAAFGWCNVLEKADIGKNSKLHGKIFEKSPALTDIVIGEGSHEIHTSSNADDWGVFIDCGGLETITLPDSWDFFDGTDGPTGYTEQFRGCNNLKEVKFYNTNTKYTSVNGIVFSKDEKELVYYPSGILDAEYEVPENVSKIGNYAFGNQKNIQNVIIPKEVIIETAAFQGCSKLNNVIIPEGMVELKNRVFANCSSLKTIVIPKSITKIDSGYVISSATFDSVKLETVYAEKDSFAANWAGNSFKEIIYCLFEGNGGDVDTEKKPVIYGDKYRKLPVPIRDGYDFAGWYTEKEGGNLISSNTIVNSDISHKVYAHWRKKHNDSGNNNMGKEPKAENKSDSIQIVDENATTIPSQTLRLSETILQSMKNTKGKKIILKWKKVAGAKGYQLQYAASKKFKAKKTKSTTKTKYTVKKLKKKKTYYMRVRAYTLSNGKKVYGKWSAIKKVKVRK